MNRALLFGTLLLVAFQGQLPRFEDFRVSSVYRGRTARTDFSTNPDARRFHTRLTLRPSDRPNFAGEWVIVTWGCGTACQSGAMVSARTGRIVDLPTPMTRGAAFRVSSRLLIIDPIRPDTRPDDASLAYYYEWTGKVFVVRDSVAVRGSEEQRPNHGL